jgi:hypothetical protein
VDASGKKENIEKQIIIRHPGNDDMEWTESEADSPDTIIIHTDREFAFNDQHPPLPPDMPYEFYWHEKPQGFPHMNGPQLEDMIEGLARSFGLEDVMPFGDMKQVVVKKKRNGKKVIITFEDRDKTSIEHSGKKEEKVIILKDNNTGMAPSHEKKIIVQTDPGEELMHEKNAPGKKETKVIIIKEEKPN